MTLFGKAFMRNVWIFGVAVACVFATPAFAVVTFTDPPPGGSSDYTPPPTIVPGGPYTGANNPVSAVPEPATWAMMLIGFGGLGLAMRRKHALSTPVGFQACGAE